VRASGAILTMRTWTTAVAIGCLLASSPSSGLDSTLRLTQYRHTAWRVQDGSFAAAPNAIAQTTDGYIWIGTGAGLVKYDGVRFAPWTAPGQQTPFSAVVLSLLGDADGTLWIGTATQLWSLKNNTLSEHVRGRINAIIEDRHHRIWVVRSRPPDPNGGLCQAAGEQPRCIGGDDRLRLSYAVTLAEDIHGNLWVGSSGQLLRWSDHSAQGYFRDRLARFEGVSGVMSVVASRDGSVWASVARDGIGIIRMVSGIPTTVTIPGLDTEKVTALYVDREQSVWIGTSNEGIYRIVSGRIDRFRADGGLSSNAVTRFFEDREGNVWVATTKGLDRLRDTRVVTFSTAEGLSADLAGSVLAAADGRVWIGNMGGLDVIHGSRVTSVRIPGRNVTALWEDRARRLWVGLDDELTLYADGEFRRVHGLDGRTHLGLVTTVTEDRDGNLWASIAGVHPRLLRIRDLAVQEEFAVQQIPYSVVLAPDTDGGIWLGLLNGQLGHYRNGTFDTFPLDQKAQPVSGLMVDSDGSVWASSASGLARWKQGVVTTLTRKNGLPCDEMVSAARDRHDTLWLYARCGLLAVDAAELERWSRHPDIAIRYRLFDVVDGAMPSASSFQPNVSVSPDGRLWFANDAVVQTVDPEALRPNGVAPPVLVEALRADRRDYAIAGLVNLPARSRDIEISYTALSFAVPEQVRFRYRLEGRDEVWSDAGTRRQAFYNDLPPGTYRFRVIAANNDGVWNEAGAVLDFSIAPAYYQTRWFRLASLITVLVALVTWYQFRLRQIARDFNLRLDERVNERTRIARELHDTLLQSFQGLMLRFQSARDLLPAQPAKAVEALDGALDRADQAIAEGRDAIQNLRSSTTVGNELAQALTLLAEELTCGANGEKSSAAFRISVEGSPRDLHPIVRDDIHRIAREALRNAFCHAQAAHIEAEVTYGAHEVRLRIRDDGKGIDTKHLSAGRARHWGLAGMRERAAQIGARLNLWSDVGAGTEVELRIPGSVAYGAPSGRAGVFRPSSRQGGGR
jgi:signal transduction histidine kinase/ligand-binding sensor domain-containing protein